MKPGVAVKKMISAFLLFLLMSGMYGGIIALSNRYLREHGMLFYDMYLLQSQWLAFS